MKVHISGYNDQQKKHLDELVKKFSLVNYQFTQETEILICDCVFNQKYNVAKSKKIKVVKQDWLLESNKQEKLLDYKNFELKAFNNLKFYFQDIDTDLIQQLILLIEKNQGQIVSQRDDSNYVIVQNQRIEVRNSQNKDIIWVYYYWIQICDYYQEYIAPDKFMCLDQNIQRNKVKLVPPQNLIQKDMEKLDPCDDQLNLFNNFLFYLHHTVDKEKYNIVKDLINLLGGFYVTNEIQNVTHVVATSLEISELEKYENQQKFFVVHPNYIYNTYAFKTRLIEVQYSPIILRDKSEDTIKSQNLPFLRSTSQTQEPRFKTFLFKNYYFYLDPKIPDFKEYQLKIIENSGNVLVKLSNTHQKIICLLADGDRKNFRQQTEQILGKGKINYFSFRWIDICLERKSIIKDIGREYLVQALPINFKVPFESFKNKPIAIKGFDDKRRYVLKDLIKILGGNYVKYNDQTKNLNVIVADSNIELYKNCHKKKLKWIFQCTGEGKFIEQFIYELLPIFSFDIQS